MNHDPLVFDATSRHARIVDPLLLPGPVTIIGLGGIGSHVLDTLARLGCRRFILYDPDTVAVENLGAQRYAAADVGCLKVEASRAHLVRCFPHLQETIMTIPEAYGGSPLDGVVICGVDSMQARSTIWRTVRLNDAIPLFLDGRTAGEAIDVIAVRPTLPDDVELYERTQFPDEDALDMSCGEHAAPHVHSIVSGLMATALVRYVREEAFPRRLILFLTTYHITVIP